MKLRLIHDAVQPGPPLDEELLFGLQDVKGEVHAGSMQADGSIHFELSVELRATGKSSPSFHGIFVHGPVAKRFLYLSWKRHGSNEHPWGWRVKIPLSGLDQSMIQPAHRSDGWLEANVIGRRPHTTEPIAWRAVPPA